MDSATTEQPSHGSLEKGISGQYNFDIPAIFREAWQKTRGIKATYWKAIIIFLVITLLILAVRFGFDFLAVIIYNTLGLPKPQIHALIATQHDLLGLITIFITAPLGVGLLMIGIRHCANLPVTAKSLVSYYPYWRKLWVRQFILVVITSISQLHLIPYILPIILFFLSIYVIVSYLMFEPLIVEKQLSVWDALETSRKTIAHHWFKTLWFLFLFILITLGSVLTLGIAFIWTLPWLNNATGILYREMFGVQTLAETPH